MQDRFHLIWADKIVLWLASAVVALFALGWCLVAVAAGVDGANHVVMSFGADSGDDLLIGLATLWAALRAIDYLRGGQTRAIFVPSDRHEDVKRSLSVGNDLAHHF
jgi:hypothetical protein